MAELPTASVSLSTSGGGRAPNGELVCILSCMQSGTAAQVARYTNVADILSAYGYGEGLELAAHYVEQVKKPVLFAKIATATAGAVGAVDQESVTGTSVVTFTGTPLDDEEIVVEVLTGGTIGTAGIEIRCSRDGGVTWGGTIRLGTATSYLIPDSGVTVNFAAGTLVAEDFATAACSAPRWDSTGLAACFDAIAAGTNQPRIIVVCGDVTSASELQSVIDEINAYETSNGRHARVFCSPRDRYADAVAQYLGTHTVTTSNAGKTYTRSAGSYVTDGFKAGMTVTFSGFVQSASNGAKTLTTVAATVLTVSEAIGTDEAAVAATTAVGVETKATWRSAVNTILGLTPQTEKVSHRTLFGAGRARRKSPINSSRKRRPATWPIAIRAMQHDIHISPAKIADGNLDGWTIHDEDGLLEEHDERVDGGLLAMRAACLTTVDDYAGVYVALPVTLDNDGAPLSRLPVGCVADRICAVAKRETTRLLGSEVILNADGTITEGEAKRIEALVKSALEAEVLTRYSEGQRASSVSFTISRDIDMSVPGAEVPCTVRFVPLGYFEDIATTVYATKAA